VPISLRGHCAGLRFCAAMKRAARWMRSEGTIGLARTSIDYARPFCPPEPDQLAVVKKLGLRLPDQPLLRIRHDQSRQSSTRETFEM
jgi:hypothetical protein